MVAVRVVRWAAARLHGHLEELEGIAVLEPVALKTICSSGPTATACPSPRPDTWGRELEMSRHLLLDAPAPGTKECRRVTCCVGWDLYRIVPTGALGACSQTYSVDPRPDRPHPILQRGHRMLPADPLRDHRPGIRGNSASTARTCASTRQPRPRCPHVLRWPVRRQRRTHRVPRDPQPASDLADRHPLGPPQPPDLRPVLHTDHPPRSWG